MINLGDINPFMLLFSLDILLMTCIYLSNSSKKVQELNSLINTLSDKLIVLEKQAEENQEIIRKSHDVNASYHLLYNHLYNLHSARDARNNMHYLYVNKPRKNDIIRGHEEANHAYKNAKDEFTKFILQT